MQALVVALGSMLTWGHRSPQPPASPRHYLGVWSSFLHGSCICFKGREVGSLSAGEGMGFSSLGKFGFPRSIVAGLVVAPPKWGRCKGKNLCCGETAGDGGTLGHCLGVQPLQAGAMTRQ